MKCRPNIFNKMNINKFISEHPTVQIQEEVPLTCKYLYNLPSQKLILSNVSPYSPHSVIAQYPYFSYLP